MSSDPCIFCCNTIAYKLHFVLLFFWIRRNYKLVSFSVSYIYLRVLGMTSKCNVIVMMYRTPTRLLYNIHVCKYVAYAYVYVTCNTYIYAQYTYKYTMNTQAYIQHIMCVLYIHMYKLYI